MAFRLFLLLVVPVLGSASPKEESDSAAEISADRIKAHVAYLASDRLEGRDPDGRGEILTTEYIAAEFKKAGLKRRRTHRCAESLIIVNLPVLRVGHIAYGLSDRPAHGNRTSKNLVSEAV